MNMLDQTKVKDAAFEGLEKSKREFEAEMQERRTRDKSRAMFTAHLPEDQQPERSTHIDKLVKTKSTNVMEATPHGWEMVVQDVIAICVGTDKKGWTASYKDILNSLRGSRWKTYTLQGDRTWTINTDEETQFLHKLLEWGFDDAVQGPYTIYDRNKKRSEMKWEKVYLKPNNERLEARKKIEPPASNRLPLEVSLSEDVDEVLDALRGEKDQRKKRVLRAKLRRMGHRGGLRSVQE